MLLNAGKITEAHINVRDLFLCNEVDNFLGLGKHDEPFRTGNFKK